jgi:hypothetical protein
MVKIALLVKNAGKCSEIDGFREESHKKSEKLSFFLDFFSNLYIIFIYDETRCLEIAIRKVEEQELIQTLLGCRGMFKEIGPEAW